MELLRDIALLIMGLFMVVLVFWFSFHFDTIGSTSDCGDPVYIHDCP